MSDSVQPQRQQPTRLPRPWDSPGKITGVGCHFLLQCMKVKSESEFAQLPPTLSDSMDCSPPGSPVPGILQARSLEWVAISFSNAWKWKVKVKSLSRVRLLATPWTAAYQAPTSMGFARQEYWSGVPLPSLNHFPNFCLYKLSDCCTQSRMEQGSAGPISYKWPAPQHLGNDLWPKGDTLVLSVAYPLPELCRSHFTNEGCEPAKWFQSSLILCDPMDCSPLGFPVHGILQARILEWIAMPSSRGFSQPRDWTYVSYVSCIGRQFLYH